MIPGNNLRDNLFMTPERSAPISDFTGPSWLSYVNRGHSCTLWGNSVNNMTQCQLIGFIGYLDELIEREREERNGTDATAKREVHA